MSAEDKSIIVLNFFVLYVYLNKHLIPLMIILSPQQEMIISNMIFSINYSVLIATFLYFIYPPIKEIPTIEHATAIGVDIYTIDAFFKIQYST